MKEYELDGEPRTETGTSATRRMRRIGKIPAVIYGGGEAPASVAFQYNIVAKQMENEAFYSHLLTVRVDGKEDQTVLKALQRHPATDKIMHMDLQRVVATQPIVMRVPLHFLGEEKCPGKKAGGVVSHLAIDVEVSCLPKDLPEFISVDMSDVRIGQSVHLSELALPDGVTIVALAQGREDLPVVTIQAPRGVAEEAEVEEGEAPAEGAEAAAPPAPTGETDESS